MQGWRAALVWALCACCGCGSSGTFSDAGSDAIAGGDVIFGGDAGAHNDFQQPVLDTGVPSNAPSLFGGPDQAGAGPCLYEPEIGSLFPNNWLRPRFRFQTTQSENLFEIELVVANEKSPLYIYTTKSGYVMDKATWSIITSVGVGTMHVRVRSAVVSGSTLTGGPWKGSEGDMTIAPVAANGSVVYWTSSNGTVLKGFKIGAETVQSVITPTQAGTACVGCHTSTPDGLDAALSASNNPGDGAPSFIELRSVDGTASVPSYIGSGAAALIARTYQYAPSFTSAHWNTGDRVMLSMFNVNNKSEIVWTDLEATSQAQGTGWNVLARGGDANPAASAAFNHAGTTIVYTSASSVGSGMLSDDGRIFTVPYNNRAGGTATALAGASDTNYVQFYPVYAADDRYVAFDRVPSGQPNPNNSNVSYNNPNAEVFVVPASGGTATRLRANDPPACMSAKSPGVTNSWPKWSPEVKTANGSSYYFMIFSSTRDPGASGPQLYVAPMTVDASNNITTYSALYLWNQPETEKNHTPAWDVFQLPGPN